MPFIPHSKSTQDAMLNRLKMKHMDDLFSEIPASLKGSVVEALGPGLSEMQIRRLMEDRSAQDGNWQCYLGGGSYQHHIPASVWHVISRGEYLTAYTPYQAECSQGTLQLLYEYQTMMSSLMGMDVSNASLYDGANSIAEAILMCVRQKRQKTPHVVWVPEAIAPNTLSAIRTLTDFGDIEVKVMPEVEGRLCPNTLKDFLKQTDVIPTAMVIAQPNYFGLIEDADALTRWAREQGIYVIGAVNPLSMALLKPPGQWGDTGADIACGEAQPFGMPLSSGGPYLGFICANMPFVRQLPGRIVGQSIDADNNRAFCLTLQAREQHIRRAKATSNVCTNQGLLVACATVYMALVGPSTLREIALQCHQNTRRLKTILEKQGFSCAFDGPYFHEIVVKLPVPVAGVVKLMEKQKILAGLPLTHCRNLENALLVCVTETKTDQDLTDYAVSLSKAVELQKTGVASVC